MCNAKTTPHRFGSGATFSTVEVIRLPGGSFEVIAFDLFGVRFQHRQFSKGRARRQWALDQAAKWAARHYLQFSGTVYQ